MPKPLPRTPATPPAPRSRQSADVSHPFNDTPPPEPAIVIAPPPCRESDIVVRCGLLGCDVLVDGKKQGTTEANGELHITVAKGAHNIVVNKSGYESVHQTVTVGCGEGEPANLLLKTRPYDIRVRTNLPDCDIFLNNSAAPAGRTDEQGNATLRAVDVQVRVEARKNGYLTSSANVTPDTARQEVTLTLMSLPARLYLSANVPQARARIDAETVWRDAGEPLSLMPGNHQITVTVLGFTPAVLTVTARPNEKLEQVVTLQRLPVNELLAQATDLLAQRNWRDLQTLCRYALQTEPNNAAAHRLSGLGYLENQDYVQAEPHLRQAIKGGASIQLRIRRHAQEKFELNKGHDTCAGWLAFSPNRLEYRGQTVTTENFSVPAAQIQIIGLQIKKDTALTLSLKIADEKGKKRDYNFFSPEKELTGEGKPYLEMISRLLGAL